MALWDRVSQFLALEPWREPELQTRSGDSIADLLARFNVPERVWRPANVGDALGVPAIQRAISLIASTTGMLSVQGFRNGAAMSDPPRVIARPDPFHTSGEFYSSTAASMAKRGEFVWWIAMRDTDNMASALIVVPPNELVVEENPRNRLIPSYTWGSISGTRFSGANPDGEFVHVKYPLADPFDLRGQGPLQLNGAAVSVAVEAQQWAANFYADGGKGGTTVKSATYLGVDKDTDGYSEADRLRLQWIARAHNSVRVIDPSIESVEEHEPNEAGAQMLESRNNQNGEAARMFGIPGSLLEYQQSGASLTYQNLEGEFTKLVRGCLQPLYLEPIEQAMSDLLSRSTVMRFNVKGFLRADIKTRFEVHELAIKNGIYDPETAQREEGIIPGDVEFAPVLYSPPTAIPSSLPIQTRSLGGLRDIRCPQCFRLVGKAEGRAELYCRHCKAHVAA